MSTILTPLHQLGLWIRSPQHDLRLNATFSTALVLLQVPLLLFLLQCHLARVQHRDTRLPRFILAAILFPTFVILGYGVRWTPGHAPASIVTTMTGLFLAVRSADLGLSPTPFKRTGESKSLRSRSFAVRVYDEVCDAIEFSMNLRGIGFDFGQGTGLKLPKDNRSLRPKSLWIRQTILYHLIPNYLVLDFANNFLLRYRPVQELEARVFTMQQIGLIDSLVIKTLSPIVVTTSISLAYAGCSLAAVLLLQSPPETWPPLFGDPWFSTSLHSFWAVRWHQILRRTFFVTGGYPLQCVFGRYGLIVGTFLSSATFHSLMLLGVNDISHFDWSAFNFFAIQIVGIAAENVFRTLTGRRVGGVGGWAWTVTFLFTTADSVCNIWVREGFLSARLVPQPLSLADRMFAAFTPSHGSTPL